MDRLYAIVDIETTGSHASANGITEIAIVIFDGTKVVQKFESLVNPQQTIPPFIQSLTGIDDEMTAQAPLFEDLAPQIFNLLEGKVFVAHNVNFDYSFVHYHLKKAGYQLNSKKLCTVRLARKILPGFPSYSLGKLCRQLEISIENRHRAMGDAFATASLFKILINRDQSDVIALALKANSKEHILPPLLDKEQLNRLPHAPGVYYFKNKQKKIVYVGKAVNIYKRVCSHFANNNPDEKKQAFLKHVKYVDFEVCGSELQALIFEAIEIKRLWPKENRALKNPELRFALYVYENQAGYLTLGVGKKIKFLKPYHSFNSKAEAILFLRKLIENHELCPKLCGFKSTLTKEIHAAICCDACLKQEDALTYNQRVAAALKTFADEFKSYLIIDEGRDEHEKCCILIEKGDFYGMGYLQSQEIVSELDDIKSKVTPYPSYNFIQKTVFDFAFKNPDKLILLQ
ncbi:exonuclease domain-containing protein [Pedobacter glucosidilyticus]|uniref:exonuclease domain-containing protein n=1 Tax=Pedobacter glucosidilyticus TaxID=1122941 RepID=UPI0003F753D5|nr:exonuclease domain-containing protein [Pedobacter glucosidilyticus]